MYSIVNILCCIALICSPVALAENERFIRRSPLPVALESPEYLVQKSNKEGPTTSRLATVKLSDSDQTAAVILDSGFESSNTTENEAKSSAVPKDTTEGLTWATGANKDEHWDSNNSVMNDTDTQTQYAPTISQPDSIPTMTSETSTKYETQTDADSLASATTVSSEAYSSYNTIPTSVATIVTSSQIALSSAENPKSTSSVVDLIGTTSLISSNVLTSTLSATNSLADNVGSSSSSGIAIKSTETISISTPMMSNTVSSFEPSKSAPSSFATDQASVTKTIILNSTQPVATESYYSTISSSPSSILSSSAGVSSSTETTSNVISVTQISNATAPASTMSLSSSTEVLNSTVPASTMTLSSTTISPETSVLTSIFSPTIILSTSFSSATQISNATVPAPSATSSTSTDFNTTAPVMTATSSPYSTSTDTLQYSANSTTALQSNTASTTLLTTDTAVYTSYTISPSSTLVPISANTTSGFTPGSLTVTPPYQPTSQPPNSTYITSSMNFNASSTSYLPTQTSSEIKSSSSLFTIVVPTATNTGSTFIPSSIIAQTSATYTTGQTSTTSTGIPSALPKIVQNPLSSSSPSQPVDTAEVQIGFEWALNYPFVVGHPLSTSQIFTYLPIGIADGIGLKPDQIIVENLFPLDTTAELQYITTVARVFIPASMVNTLRIDLGIAASPLYQNEDESVRTLMNYINPAIPFFPGSVMDPEPSSTVINTLTSPTLNSGDSGVFNSNPQPAQSASAKGTTAGIALAACGGAAAYGAAMFLLARRYKHRQQRSKISDSSEGLDDRGDMTENQIGSGEAGALMTGGRISPTYDRHSRGSGRTGHTARTAHISAPMMAENSLGWN